VHHLAIPAHCDVRAGVRRAVNIPCRSIQKGPIVSKGELIEKVLRNEANGSG
jgi:hypothetical protein